MPVNRGGIIEGMCLIKLKKKKTSFHVFIFCIGETRLLLQLRKRRKSQRQASTTKTKQAEESVEPTAEDRTEVSSNGGPTASTSNVGEDAGGINSISDVAARESDSDDESDSAQQCSDLSDSELDVDNYYFLQVWSQNLKSVQLYRDSI